MAPVAPNQRRRSHPYLSVLVDSQCANLLIANLDVHDQRRDRTRRIRMRDGLVTLDSRTVGVRFGQAVGDASAAILEGAIDSMQQRRWCRRTAATRRGQRRRVVGAKVR